MNRHDKFMKDLELEFLKLKASAEKGDVILENDKLEIAKIVGSRNLPTDDREEWDGRAAVDRMIKRAGGKDNLNFSKFKQGFVWVMPGEEENITGYKLPFADVIGGTLKATWGGVNAAMGAVRGARGGTKGVDVKKAQSFLASYYKKFDKEVPK